MFSGMGDAATTNARWHMLLKEGQTGLSTAFDSRPDGLRHRLTQGRGECGNAVSPLIPWRIPRSHERRPLDKITTSMPSTRLQRPCGHVLRRSQIQGIPLNKIGGTSKMTC